MITLNASGGSVAFTFSGNSTYLNDGTITVPVNSLALIIDESDMVTFKKSQSSDIFVSANIAEFGMTKDELIAWFKENAIGSTGGGGDITSGEVQTMIDESISGKADSSAVTEEISAAVSGKQDTLVSGTNIKTINNESILGSGNIDIQGGGSSLPISAGTGSNSIIVGSNFNEASGSYSVAQGEWTLASGGTSHAEGTRTKTYGIFSHAEGSYSEASGSYSHAEGDSTYATAQASHSEGGSTSATSMSSHSEGRYTQANGMGSHSEGYYTIAENEYEHASGKFNASNTGESTSAQTLFSVGNGGWDETLQENVRHNAFEIRKNGDIYFFDGTNDVKLQDVISNILNRLTTIENNS